MRRLADVVGAAVLLVLAIVCWNRGVTERVFAAVPDGAPEFVSTHYSGSWIGAATVCVLIALLLMTNAARTTVRGRSHTR
ncbi:MAG: hypothetical protein WBQ44_19400 [Rhodococcus sp. (in: high G+C Gram-positive bacteria)]